VKGPDLARWRAAGGRVALDVGSRTVSVFRRIGGPRDADWWTLLHGWPTTSWDWSFVAPAIEAEHRTLALDWPGLGASDKGDRVPYDIDFLTDTLLALWGHQGVTSTRIVAHDVGTIVAQELLARDREGDLPVGIRSVTWLNGSIYPDLYNPTDTQLALLDPDSGPLLADAIDADLFMAGIASVHHPDHQPTADILQQHWEAFGERDGVREMPRFLRYIPDRASRADRLVRAIEDTATPQRFVWGEADLVSGSAQSSRIRERFGVGVDLVTYVDSSHYPHTEQPDEVAHELLRPWP
jgi:pimeloyl-ACP methyl ester carboxylesterase